MVLNSDYVESRFRALGITCEGSVLSRRLMTSYKPDKLFFAGWVLVWAVFSYAEPVDPRNHDEWHSLRSQNHQTLKYWLPVRIRQLEEERAELMEKIAGLPQHAPKPLSDHSCRLLCVMLICFFESSGVH